MALDHPIQRLSSPATLTSNHRVTKAANNPITAARITYSPATRRITVTNRVLSVPTFAIGARLGAEFGSRICVVQALNRADKAEA